MGRQGWLEILEAVALSIVAVATAWSGYQAAKWDALSAKNYSMALHANVDAQTKAALAGQDRLFDIVTFNGWVAARLAENDKLTAFYERRFRPEYATAFAAWQKLDPLHNPAAPPGPIFMPEYTSAIAHESERLSHEGAEYFEKGVSTRETGDDYVKVTVFLATVLLLTALSQRFQVKGPRIAVLVVALILLSVSSYWIATFPRA